MTRTSWDTFLLVSLHIQIQIYKSPFLETLKEILREIDNKLTEEGLEGIIEEVDEDGSGTLDFDGNNYTINTISNGFISIRVHGNDVWIEAHFKQQMKNLA